MAKLIPLCLMENIKLYINLMSAHYSIIIWVRSPLRACKRLRVLIKNNWLIMPRDEVIPDANRLRKYKMGFIDLVKNLVRSPFGFDRLPLTGGK